MSDQRPGPKRLDFILKAAAIAVSAAFLLLFFGIAALYLLAGVKGAVVAGTLQSGCAVDAYTDGPRIRAEFRDDTATIHSGATEVVVGPGEILVDQKSVYKLPDGVRHVSVHRERGHIRIAADGRDVYTSR